MALLCCHLGVRTEGSCPLYPLGFFPRISSCLPPSPLSIHYASLPVGAMVLAKVEKCTPKAPS